MKFKSLSPFILATGAIFCAAAQAQNNIDFQGRYIAISCTADFEGSGSASGGVSMPNVDQTFLVNAGDVAGEKTFTIGLSGCGTNPNTTARAHFYADPQNVADGRLVLDSSSSGSGWQYQILPMGASTQLDIKTSASIAPELTDPGVEVSLGSGNLQYRVRYYRTSGSLTTGTGIAQGSYAIYFD